MYHTTNPSFFNAKVSFFPVGLPEQLLYVPFRYTDPKASRGKKIPEPVMIPSDMRETMLGIFNGTACDSLLDGKEIVMVMLPSNITSDTVEYYTDVLIGDWKDSGLVAWVFGSIDLLIEMATRVEQANLFPLYFHHPEIQDQMMVIKYLENSKEYFLEEITEETKVVYLN